MLLPIPTTPSYTSEGFRISVFFEKVVVQLSIGNDANWILVPPWTGRSAGRDEKRHKGGRFSVPETGRLGLKPKGCETA